MQVVNRFRSPNVTQVAGTMVIGGGPTWVTVRTRPEDAVVVVSTHQFTSSSPHLVALFILFVNSYSHVCFLDFLVVLWLDSRCWLLPFFLSFFFFGCDGWRCCFIVAAERDVGRTPKVLMTLFLFSTDSDVACVWECRVLDKAHTRTVLVRAKTPRHWNERKLDQSSTYCL